MPRMENEYHSPYDQHDLSHDQESDQLNHYEAPSMLARNPSGSLYIPSGKSNKSTYYLITQGRNEYNKVVQESCYVIKKLILLS